MLKIKSKENPIPVNNMSLENRRLDAPENQIVSNNLSQNIIVERNLISEH